jgi:polysaccharide deacetylase family protein (PEP-CTERM system associated)
MTIDVECWFHAHNLHIPKSEWDRQSTRVVENVRRILDLLRAHESKATFFVLGWVADRHPEVVRMIDKAGQEIGTHGYLHDKITDMTPYHFEKDLVRSLEAIGRHTSQKVVGHRASNFSVVESTLWALEILARNGIGYDSSIFPARRPRYGIPDYPRCLPHTVELPGGATIREIPMSIFRIGARAVPVCGGGYLRLYPYAITDRVVRHGNLRGRPTMVYFHPWEFDPGQKRVKTGVLEGFQHYVNLESTERKIHRLLERFPFTSVAENLESDAVRALVEREPLRLVDSRPLEAEEVAVAEGELIAA